MGRQRRQRRETGEPAATGPRSRTSRALPFAVAAGVVIAAALLVVPTFGGEGESASPSAAVSTAEQQRLLALGRRLVRPVEERSVAEPMRLRTASFGDGSVFELAQERGNVVVVFSMAAWCITCIPEAQALAQIHERYAGEGVRVLILDIDVTEDEGDLAGFRERSGEGMQLWAMDADVEVARAYGVISLDTTIFIDREARVAYTDGSPTSYEVLAAVIEALL